MKVCEVAPVRRPPGAAVGVSGGTADTWSAEGNPEGFPAVSSAAVSPAALLCCCAELEVPVVLSIAEEDAFSAAGSDCFCAVAVPRGVITIGTGRVEAAVPVLRG